MSGQVPDHLVPQIMKENDAMFYPQPARAGRGHPSEADRSQPAKPVHTGSVSSHDALIEHLRAELAEAKARKGDMFDAEALADLIRENEPHADAQRRWQSDYNQLNNRLVDTRLPSLSDNERALLNRLQRALYAGRKGAVETV
jgi:hypothetical protein